MAYPVALPSLDSLSLVSLECVVRHTRPNFRALPLQLRATQQDLEELRDKTEGLRRESAQVPALYTYH